MFGTIIKCSLSQFLNCLNISREKSWGLFDTSNTKIQHYLNLKIFSFFKYSSSSSWCVWVFPYFFSFFKIVTFFLCMNEFCTVGKKRRKNKTSKIMYGWGITPLWYLNLWVFDYHWQKPNSRRSRMWCW